MTLNFVIPEFNIGGAGTPPLQFFRRGFNLNGSGGSQPSWRDIILHGNTALTLVNAKADSLNYLKLFGGCEQSGTPIPTVPVDIVCNNGAIKYGYTSKNLNVGTLDNQGYTSTGGTSTSTTFCGTLWKIKVSEGEKYTVSCGNFPDGISGVFVNTWKTDNTFNLRQAISMSTSYTYTIPEGVGEVNFTLYKTGGITIGSNSWMQVELGSTPTSYVPAGYGLRIDGTTETVGVYGNNIFNKNDTANIGNWYSSSASKIAGAGSNATLVMRAIPNATYYFKHCSVTGGGRAFYTEVEDWAVGSDCSAMMGNTTIDKDEVKSITVSANAKWVFFIYGRSGQTATFEEQLADFMVSLTPITASTPYEPYYNGGSATAEMLLSVNDYKDTQEVLSGVVTHNIGIKIFDGTETFINGNNGWISEDAITDQSSVTFSPYCTHFKGTTGTPTANSNTVRVYITSGGVPRVYFGLNKTVYTSIDIFKQWLADQYNSGNPVIIVYPLATATTESVTGQPLTIQAGTNVVAITQASMDNLELEVSYKAGVSVTVTEIENAQLDNSVEVTING